MLRDVIQELEKREYLEEQDEANGQEEKIVEKAAQQVNVEELRYASAPLAFCERAAARRRTSFWRARRFTWCVQRRNRIRTRASCLVAQIFTGEDSPDAPAGDGGERGIPSAAARHAFEPRQEKQPERGRQHVCRPDACPDRERALARQSRADGEHQVVAGNQEQRDQKPGGTSAAPGPRSQRHGEQGKRNTSKRKREAALNLDAGVARSGSTLAKKSAHRAARYGRLGWGPGFEAPRLDGEIALGEGGERIVARLAQGEFVDTSVTQVQLQLALAAVGHYNRFLRQSKAREVLCVGPRKKDTFPARGGRIDIVNVEDEVWEALVEDTRCNLEGSLPSAQAVFQGAESAHGQGPEPERHAKSDQCCAPGENADGDQYPAASEAEGRHGDALAIRGHVS